MNTDRKSVFLHLVLIVLLGLAVYLNSLNGDFVLDDHAFVENNTFIRDFRHVLSAFSRPAGAGSFFRSEDSGLIFYRPLQTISYMINFRIGSLEPFGYHLTNIILHILNALGIYLFIMLLFKRSLTAFLCAAFFVVHPIHSEVIAYISGRSEPLSLFFLLVALIFYLRSDKSYSVFGPAALITYFLALLSKEYALMFIPFLLICYYSLSRPLNIRRLLPFIAVTLIYLSFRALIISHSYTLTPFIADIPQRLPLLFTAIINYIRILILPRGLHMFYRSEVNSLLTIPAAAGISLSIALFLVAWKIRKKSPIVCFSILWFFTGLIPVSNLFYPLPFYMSDHYLYVASIGYFLLLASAFEYMIVRPRFLKPAAAAVFILIIFYSLTTAKQNLTWRNDKTFSENIVRNDPGNEKGYRLLGYYYLKTGKFKQAEKYSRKSFTLVNSADNLRLLATAYIRLEEYAKAEACLRQILKKKPCDDNAYNLLSFLYTQQGQPEKALTALSLAIDCNPGNINTYIRIACIHGNHGMYDSALSALETAAAIEPNHPAVNFFLAKAHLNLNNPELARQKYEKAISLGHPGDAALKNKILKKISSPAEPSSNSSRL